MGGGGRTMFEARYSRIFQTVLLFLIPVMLCSLTCGKIIYVDDDAAGANDGSSWENAYNFLQDAITTATGGDEILVAQGIYKPDQGIGITLGDRRASFRLNSGVTIKSGYAGFGESEPDIRDVGLFQTILSGDLNGDDVEVNDPCDLLSEPSRVDNSENVVTGSNTYPTAVLDGFTITAGYLIGHHFMGTGNPSGGAGMYVYYGSPTVVNCIFTGNATLGYGGGMIIIAGSNPTIVNCAFTKNNAGGGGGISFWKSPEGINPTLIDCIFDDNYASGDGGGMYNYQSNPNLTNSIFSCNFSHRSGGGIYNRMSNLELADCTFSENTAGSGGGIYSEDNSRLILTNCTFGNNVAERVLGGGMCNSDANDVFLTNCIFSGNSANRSGGGLGSNHNKLMLINCVFDENEAYGESLYTNKGGGLYTFGDAEIINCAFRNNWASEGAGVYYYDGILTVTGCAFTGNSAENFGGGLYNYDNMPDLTITNCTFGGNTAEWGGGIFNRWPSHLRMANCTFTGNVASNGNALACDPSFTTLPGRIELTNCILWNGDNTLFDPNPDGSTIAIAYSDVQGGWLGEGNIDVNPDFVQAGYWTQPSPRQPSERNWIEGDYHLKSEAGRWDPNSQSWVVDNVTSLCIDAGDPNSPVAFEPDPNGSRINMGAYGGTAEASKSPNYSWWFETTQGPVPAEGLGIILPHEHIFTDLRGPTTPGYGQADAADVVRVMSPLLSDARDKGVGVFIECTSIGVGRNVPIIAQVAEASGLPVVVPTGVYGRANFAPPEHRNMTEDELTTLFISEIRDGIEGTGIKAGFIKIATDESPMNTLIEKILRAAGRAASETGAAIASHTPTGSNAVRQVDILESIDPAIRFIWVHAQNESNRNIHVQLAARGVYIEFDSLGWNPSDDLTYITAIKNLLAAGHGDRILLSHDAGWYQPGSANGGTQKPFTYLIDTFIPKLRDAGVDDATIRMITQTNPVRAFGFKSGE